MGKVWVFDDLIGVKPAIWYNLNKGNYSEKQIIAVVSRLKMRSGHRIVSEILTYNKEKYGLEIPYAYPMHTHAIGVPSETDTDTESDTVTASSGKPDSRVSLVVSEWNDFAKEVGLVQVRTITKKRAAGIKLRLSQDGFEQDLIYDQIRQSKFLLGENDRGWKCDFDFVWVEGDKWVKIAEGKYASKKFEMKEWKL